MLAEALPGGGAARFARALGVAGGDFEGVGGVLLAGGDEDGVGIDGGVGVVEGGAGGGVGDARGDALKDVCRLVVAARGGL